MGKTKKYSESRRTYLTQEQQYISAEDEPVSYLQSEEQIIRSESQVLFSSSAYFEPCSFFSTVLPHQNKVSKFSFTAGINACREFCAMKYEKGKFGVCIPVIGCRCLTKGLGNVLQWFRDVTIDPMKTAGEMNFRVISQRDDDT